MIKPRNCQVQYVAQFDDMALYVNGELILQGCKEVNGALEVLRAVGMELIGSSIVYDIWETKSEGWPKKLSQIKDLKYE